VGAMEKAIFEFAKENPDKRQRNKTTGDAQTDEQSRAPGRDVNVKLTGAYKSGPAGDQQFSYHGSHGSGTMMASCTCGQTFKTDDEGNTQTYKIKTDTTSQVGSEFGAYKKSSSDNFQMGSYKKKPHEEMEARKYGR
ncbi:MAG TPA: hypothetical protein VLJ21_04535, partial [Candidatus Binatia bacterium]|nr:hypothetical protein [Candidatus Binatia bacterium]